MQKIETCTNYAALTLLASVFNELDTHEGDSLGSVLDTMACEALAQCEHVAVEHNAYARFWRIYKANGGSRYGLRLAAVILKLNGFSAQALLEQAKQLA